MPDSVTAANISGNRVTASSCSPIPFPLDADAALSGVNLLHHGRDEGQQALPRVLALAFADHQHGVGTTFDEPANPAESLAMLVLDPQANQVGPVILAGQGFR